MKVIFVGIHNKPGLPPLCSSTKSGKLIDRIIAKLPADVNCEKTNLYDIDYLPKDQYEKDIISLKWWEKVSIADFDIIVLLGIEVHENFWGRNMQYILKINHPASKRSYAEMNRYVSDAVEEILSLIDKSKKNQKLVNGK